MIRFREGSEALCREITARRGELIDLLAAPEVDSPAVAMKRQEIQAGQRRMQELLIGHLLEEKEVLTVSQQEELFELLRRQTGCVAHSMQVLSETASGSGACEGEDE